MIVSYGSVIACVIISCSLRVRSSNAASPSGVEEVTKENIIFGLHLVPVKIKHQNRKTGATEEIALNLDIDTLRYFNVTKEQFERGKLEEFSNGDAEVVVNGGIRIPIQLKIDEIIKYKEANGKDAFTLSKHGLMARTMADLTDPSLKPEKHPKLLWSMNNHQCKLSTIQVSGSSKSILIKLGDETVALKVTKKGPLNNNIWWDGQGLSLVAINPATCFVTFNEVIATGDFGNYRDLLWALESINNGSLIVLSSLRDGSLLLGKAIQSLSNFGSFWAPFYLYRDGWISVFIKGGKMIAESLIPNLGSLNKTSSSVEVHMHLPNRPLNDQLLCYSTWPSTKEWDARRSFCQSYEGYGMLCDCENPFRFENKVSKNSSEVIPLVIIAGRRPRHLYRLIESVGNQKGVGSDSFLIAVDGASLEMVKLTYVLQIQTLIHGRSLNVSGAARIASNLQFGLLNAHKIFSKSKYFILLEEDLILAPDFYRYMKYLSPMFEMDSSIFCVSAYNHLSFRHTSGNASAIYRVNTIPAYGWMVSKSILEYILPKILPNTVSQDWDYFLGSELIRKDREILIPDINRSFHWATAGLHLKGSWLAETHFLSKQLNEDANVDYVPLQNLMKDNYEKEFVRLLLRATTLKVDLDFKFTPQIQEGNVYALYVRKYEEKDQWGFRFVGDLLGIWSLDVRDHHNHAQRLFYKNATLLIIGIPASPYRIYMPKNAMYISPTNMTKYELEYERQAIAYSSIPIITHERDYQLPSFYKIS